MSLPDPEYDGAGEGWITDPTDSRLAVLWAGAADYDDLVAFPLYVAAIQCANFAPTISPGAPIPENWVAAQVLQCRALVRAGIVGDGDRTGDVEGVVVFPMDWTVKNLLRPKRAVPYFGGGQP